MTLGSRGRLQIPFVSSVWALISNTNAASPFSGLGVGGLGQLKPLPYGSTYPIIRYLGSG